ncbi:peptidylprolyl isomerase [Agromyces aerolatus]|uniref:peptidylprolyl isomerase n=1 Tax=Agromyces sp. LY-1074 TaxID=3074080 RepID=UPI00285B18BC|nr:MULTISPECIES: peptidylprolyl isomerase [unclassified Agromyces]MDR5700611.1 peptidylprolyl isomerase [Agromyces sp. LY-1074]MDR5707132.1 peptidylprolyl isomerase [Agromyces sp. LY-1358]
MAGNDRQAREERARLRTYQARQEVHRGKERRRVRDNVIAAAALVVVLVLAVAAQLFFFDGGPGGSEASPSPTPSAEAQPETAGEAPSPELAENRTWTGELTLNGIALGVELDGAAAPQAVASTVSLAQSGFYDGVTCHRLTTSGIFVLQCGDPSGDGTGGPGYSYGPVENAPADDVYPAGTLAMARQGGNASSQGSQFFVVYEDSTIPSDAAGGYTVLGRVTSGLDELQTAVIDEGVADGATDGAPVVPVTIDGFTVE